MRTWGMIWGSAEGPSLSYKTEYLCFCPTKHTIHVQIYWFQIQRCLHASHSGKRQLRQNQLLHKQALVGWYYYTKQTMFLKKQVLSHLFLMQHSACLEELWQSYKLFVDRNVEFLLLFKNLPFCSSSSG